MKYYKNIRDEILHKHCGNLFIKNYTTNERKDDTFKLYAPESNESYLFRYISTNKH